MAVEAVVAVVAVVVELPLGLDEEVAALEEEVGVLVYVS